MTAWRPTAADVAAGLALLGWLYLAVLHGRFWQSGPALALAVPREAPPVAVVVPARDEAALVAQSVGSLATQAYAPLRVVLVDDGSTDGTAQAALAVPGVAVLQGAERPAGWAGKLWAVYQGVAATDAPWLLLTDADIAHDPAHLATLMAHAEAGGYDLVSEMVRLHCASAAERALVPPFVYFFQMLYPFAWVADPHRRTAAAAGGTVLIRRAMLERIGGVAAYGAALIDDVELARLVKRDGGRLWLGHTDLAASIRPYPRAADLWRMIARSAYTQLRHSPPLLLGCLLGLALLFLVPPAATLARWHGPAHWMGLTAWALMAFSFEPTLERYRLSPLRAPLLPLAALFYMAATVGSALAHHAGRGVVWKRRAYAAGQA